jgi:hypothetical protein
MKELSFEVNWRMARLKITADTEDKRDDLGLGANFRRRHDVRKALLVVKRSVEALAKTTPLDAETQHEMARDLQKVHAFLESEFAEMISERQSGTLP